MYSINSIENKPHAIIFKTIGLMDVDKIINEYIFSIIKNKETEKKIIENKFLDIVRIDCHQHTLKKEEVINIINKFSRSAQEKNNKKFYIIKNIENASKEALNSLLKFLEEPTSNTYAIFTCKNINHVLPTITSRSQIFNLTSNEQEKHTLLDRFNLDDEQRKIIKHIYDDFNLLENDIRNQKFHESYDFFMKLMKKKKNSEIKKDSDEFKKMDYYQISLILKILFYYLKKEEVIELIEKIKLNPIKILLFDKIYKLINEI
ncbi:MAG: hypothetical protein LBS95_00240 [Mycoplasmataceae bacterium]|jgi:DNA polymerase-3 subunit delta'|nr:hypothetical protein [Mycoplasmataceae bacterium]